MRNKKWSEIDVLYALGIILVIFGHSHSSDWSSFSGTFLESAITFIYTFHMPLFFFIAGFLFMNSSSLEKNGYRRWIGQKALRLLTPYVILSVAAIVPKYYMENHGFDGFTGYLFKVIFAPRSGVWGHFWFLPVLLLIYVVFGLWKKLMKGRSVQMVFGVTTLLSSGLYFLPYETEWLGFSDLKEEIVFFVFGMLLNIWIYNRRKTMAAAGRILWIVTGTAISMLLVYNGDAIKPLKLITAIIMITVSWQIASLIKENRVCKWLSKNNFTIYIYSWPFQAVMMAAAGRLGFPWYFTSLSMFIIGMTAPILLVLVYKRLKVLNNRFFDLLIGMK